MGAFLVRRLGIGVLTLMVVSVLVFLMSRMTGNPVDMYLDITATAQDRAILAASMGLDQPLHVQYLIYVERLVLHGDLGRSQFFSRPVSDLIAGRLATTLQLAAASFVCTLLLSVPMGVLAAVRRGSWWDRTAKGFVFFGQALPQFWLGIMMILLFSVTFNLLPPAGQGGPETFLMPAITLGWSSAAAVTRLVRSAMLEILSSDFIRTARSKGLSEVTVLQRHALKCALIPTVAYCTATLIRNFVMGSIVVETVFGWAGMGRLAYEATFARDFPTIQGIVMVIAAGVILFNIAGDVFYGWLDPRIRYS